MITKREIAENYFKEGYNCAQSVALTFAGEIGMDEKTILKAVSPFGGGMGRLREVCGAVSGMLFVLGCVEGYVDPTDNDAKKQVYANTQRLVLQFKEKNGSYICRELLALKENLSEPTPEKRTAQYYAKRPCGMLVGDAAEILEKYFEEKLNVREG